MSNIYKGKRFVAVNNSENGEVSESTVFSYHQENNLMWAEYSGGDVIKGFMIGLVNDDNSLDFHYQHLNNRLETRIGKCHSIPEILPDGKLRLHETWQWLNRDCSKGDSIIEEI